MGFTLNELIISLAIFAMISSTGISGLLSFIANQKAESGYYRLFTLLQFARSESVIHHRQVIVCPTNDDKNCSKDWNENLMVFVDENHNESYDDKDVLLQTLAATENRDKRLLSAFGSTRYIRFNFDGSSGSNNGRLTYCVVRGTTTYARQLIIAKTGRIRKGESTDAMAKCSA